jgi:hypothetical protein
MICKCDWSDTWSEDGLGFYCEGVNVHGATTTDHIYADKDRDCIRVNDVILPIGLLQAVLKDLGLEITGT